MRRERPYPAGFFLCSLVLLGLLLPCTAGAANRASDLKWTQSPEGRTTLALLMEREPAFSLRSEKGNHVLLRLYDTVAGTNLSKAIGKHSKAVQMESEAPSALRLTLLLKGPLREVECSWLSREKVLLFQTSSGEAGKNRGRSGNKTTSLKNLRFGIQEAYTRMVADLSERVAWEMIAGEDRTLSFHLASTTTALKRDPYGPFQRLRKVEVTQKAEGVELRAEAEASLSRVRVFWLKDAGKWVVDFFDKPAEKGEETVWFASEATGKEPEKATVVADATKGEGAQEAVAKEDKGDDRVPVGADVQKPNEALVEDQGSMVRVKISRSGEGPSGEKSEPPTPGVVQQSPKMTFEPRMENSSPVALLDGPIVQGLHPPEAFLYGRIKEALEIKDYEKGAALVEEFMGKFPGSPLLEDMTFLAGDCRFALLERGEKSLLPKVMKDYQDALSRYPKSKRVAGTLLKIARAHALSGNNYEAVGYLSMALTQFREGAHVPKALLLRGHLNLKINQAQKAIEDFKDVMERFPASPFADEARYGIAEYLHAVGMYEEAERKLSEIDSLKPQFYLEHPEYLLLRARNSFYQKNYDRSREYYFRALNLGHQPEGPDLLIAHIGDTFYHQSQEKEAEKFYKMAVDYYPETEGASIAKLRIAGQSSGVTLYEEVHQKNANRPVGDLALLEMAAKFYAKGQYPMAIETLRRLMGKATQPDIQREAKHLYFRSAEKEIRGFHEGKEYARLTGYYQSADPGLLGSVDPETLLLVGEAFKHLGEHREATVVFSQISPRDLNTTSRGRYVASCARNYMAQGDDENAEAVLVRGIKESMPPEDQQRINLLLAEVSLRKGEQKRAFDLYQSLLAEKRLLSDREMAGVYFSMGKISNHMNRYEKARESLNRCIALVEKDKDGKDLMRSAFTEMGNSYYHEGRYNEAIRFYQQSLDQDYSPEGKAYWEVRYQLALSHLGVGDNATAQRMMNEIAEEGDPAVQQKAQIKMGLIGLERQLKRLPLGRKVGVETL